MYYGYIRVSSLEQNLERQREALARYAKDNNMDYDVIFEDKATGKNFDRKQYQALKRTVTNGDTIVIKELDRLGRNYMEIKEELSYFKNKGVKVEIIDMPVFNIEDETLSELLNNLMIELLGYITQKEVESIRRRTQEGIERAKAQGKHIGRPKITLNDLTKDFYKWYPEWQKGKITAVDFAKLVGVSRTTIYRYIDMYEKKLAEA